jgi:hypothetical protein
MPLLDVSEPLLCCRMVRRRLEFSARGLRAAQVLQTSDILHLRVDGSTTELADTRTEAAAARQQLRELRQRLQEVQEIAQQQALQLAALDEQRCGEAQVNCAAGTQEVASCALPTPGGQVGKRDIKDCSAATSWSFHTSGTVLRGGQQQLPDSTAVRAMGNSIQSTMCIAAGDATSAESSEFAATMASFDMPTMSPSASHTLPAMLQLDSDTSSMLDNRSDRAQLEESQKKVLQCKASLQSGESNAELQYNGSLQRSNHDAEGQGNAHNSHVGAAGCQCPSGAVFRLLMMF